MIAKPDFLLESCRLHFSDIDKNLEKRGGEAVVDSFYEKSEELVTLWEPFEHYPKESILENIDDSATLLERMWDIGFRAGQANPKKVKRNYNRSLEALKSKE